MNREIGALTGLRGVASVWVLLYHCCSLILGPLTPDTYKPFRLLLGGGYLGVDIFFVLSGFVLALNYQQFTGGCGVRQYAAYIWKRLARIYPVHVAGLVLLAVAILAHKSVRIVFFSWGVDFSIPALIKSLLLVQAWTPSLQFSWNAPAWSISAEAAAYLCLPFLVWVASAFRSKLLIVLVIATLFSVFAWFSYFVAPHGLARVAAEFTAGVLLYRLWEINHNCRSSLMGWVALSTLALMILASGGIDYAARRDLSMQLLAPAACIVVYGLACATGASERLLSSDLMQYLGRISFSLYIVHYTFVIFARNWLNIKYMILPAPLTIATALVVVAVSLLCAHWFYFSIEEPSRKAMLRMANAPSSRNVSSSELFGTTQLGGTSRIREYRYRWRSQSPQPGQPDRPRP
jgi:peptidoglycan/LPS O-acetylase OafA/YrhL